MSPMLDAVAERQADIAPRHSEIRGGDADRQRRHEVRVERHGEIVVARRAVAVEGNHDVTEPGGFLWPAAGIGSKALVGCSGNSGTFALGSSR